MREPFRNNIPLRVFVYRVLWEDTSRFLLNLQSNLYTMKKGILILLLFCSAFADAQSLKDALFSGRLKNDNNTVIRKGEDLSAKMVDTTRKAAVDTIIRFKGDSLTLDSIAKGLSVHRDTVLVSTADNQIISTTQPAAQATENPVTATAGDTTAVVATESTEAPKEAAAPVAKSNNTLIKEYVDSVAKTLNTDVLNSKRVKKGTYYVTVSYAIETDGKVDITEVIVSPENAFLQSSIRSQLELEPPVLEPVKNSAGTPRKVSRKYNFTLNKE